ncbi:MAG TPA: M14 family zinc carboxypeptidase [Solirubrobacteraceae bacterium]|nr:M14 family zinc carboxypeptidase [Solirubrobacteraceae bacterium]
MIGRRGSAAALLLACATVLGAPRPAAAQPRCSARAAPDPTVPSWEAVNGFALGSRPAAPAELDRFLLALDAASARVVVRRAGTSAAGRPLRYAIVGEPAALRPPALGALRARLAAIVAGRASASSLPRRAVVWLAGSVHGDEPSGADADARLLGELAAGRDCATLRRLHELIVAVMPVQNPDGRVAGTRVSATGFDLNRDWLAAGQPETAATLRAVRALPPLAFVDQHEQAAATAFVPPYAEPVHHEVPAAARRALTDVFGPALRTAVASTAPDTTSGPRLDLLYPGYADSATTLLFGAAGMTVEAPGGRPLAERVALHAAAGRAVLDAAARHRAALVRAWAASARAAVAQGVSGRVQGRGAGSERTFGFAVRADRRGADAAALVAILLRAGVRVERLGAPVRAPALRAWTGGRARAAMLPAGTYLVPAAQGAKHWLQAVLERDARSAPGPVSDVSVWSLPLLMGLGGGALQAPLPHAAVRRAVIAPPAGRAPLGPAAAYVFPGDATASAGLALALLEDDGVVRRLPGPGGFVAQGVAPAGVAAAAHAHRTTVRAAGATAATRGVALRRPRVALLASDPPATLAPSAGWARQALQTTLGLHPEVVTPAALVAGRLAGGGFTHLLVPDGPPSAFPPGAAEAVGAFVRGGGTYVGWRARGLEVATLAGLTSAVRAPSVPGLRVLGAAVAVDLRAGWATAGGGRRVVVLDDDDPVLDARSGVAGRLARAGHVLVAGAATGLGAAAGTPAIVDERGGDGRTVLFSFDPAFRGIATGALRLLAEALLEPA